MSDNTDQPESDFESAGLALAVASKQAELPAIAAKVAAPELTPAQARVEAVSNLLHKAYEKASTLALTPEESKALQAEFADSDFRTGAGGKENLIYIEHAALRQRLNEVFGLGQWSLVVRNRWGEDYQYFNKTSRQQEKACRIYVEACLLVRGCFVAEAIGDMVYYPANQQTNYGDAVEGAKSAALRRCAKELGVGLQAWRKDFCEFWMKKHAGHRPAVQEAAPVKPASTPAPKPANVTPMPAPAKDESAADRKARFIAMCKTAGGGSLDFANELFRELGTLLPNETMDDLPEDKVPATRKVAQNLLDEIKARAAVADDIPMGDAPKSVAFSSGSNDEAPERAAEPEPEGTKLRGFVAAVTTKPTAKGGTRWGICIVPNRGDKQGGEWLNTFDDVDGDFAKSLRGEAVICYYTEGKYGKDLVHRGIKSDEEIIP